MRGGLLLWPGRRLLIAVLSGCLALMALGSARTALAVPGDLDTAFDGDGKVATNVQSSDLARANAVAIQPDGKVVAAGGTNGILGDSAGDFALVRYNADGSIDTSFGTDGKVFESWGAEAEANAVAIQPDGKIVVAGTADYSATGDRPRGVIARYNTNGSLDTTFSPAFTAGTEIIFDLGDANGVAIQSDGQIVVAGDAGISTRQFTLVRYAANGTEDAGFGVGGRVTTGFGNDDMANGVAIQPDGKIVAAGTSLISGHDDLALARYNAADGSLDTSFDGDGKQTTDLGANDGANAVALQGDGRIVAAGWSNTPSDSNFAIARYNANGSLDTGFDSDGVLTTDLGGSDHASSVAVQPDGKLVAAGDSFSFQSPDAFAIARYNANGSLDTGFDADGKVRTDFGSGGIARGMRLQPDGKIVAAGVSAGAFALARYNSNGSLDTGFDGDGTLTTKLTSEWADFTGGAVRQPDGKLVVAGSTALEGRGYGPSPLDFAVARYNADGSLDAGFGDGGLVTTDFRTGGESSRDSGEAVALAPDGKIVVAGSSFSVFTRDTSVAIARYNPDGTLDTSFSSDGRLTAGLSDTATAAVVQADGKIVVADSGASSDRLLRYTADGSFDTAFAQSGFEASALALQPDGRIVEAGQDFNGGTAEFDFAVARHNADGSLDSSFDGDGKQTTDIGGNDAARAVAVQSDGKVVVAGNDGDSQTSSDDFALARYNANGTPDTSFDGDGQLTTDFGADDGANAVGIQSDGSIVAAGSKGRYHTVGAFYPATADLAVARYTSGGALDPGFGSGGKVTTDFGGSKFDEATAVAISPGLISVAGWTQGTGNGDFAVARYLSGSTPPPRTLNVALPGAGSGTVTGPGINCPGDCSETYASGTAVTLVATTGTGAHFGGWGGACSGTGPCQLTMSADKSVTANFVAQRTLTVTTAGTGTGTITGPGINCPGDCTETYDDGTAVSLSASGTGGSTFAGWSGACTGTGACDLTMDADQGVTGSFTGPPRTLTVTTSGAGTGTVTGTGINCPGDCTETYPAGTSVTLTASATGGSTFAGWGGACSGTGICQLTMNGNKAVSAGFGGPLRTLSVNFSGGGTGAITGPGINCSSGGSFDCSETYADGTAVTLTAVATGGDRFDGWGGACGGTGTCQLTMNADKSVSAIFTFVPSTFVPPAFVPPVPSGGTGGSTPAPAKKCKTRKKSKKRKKKAAAAKKCKKKKKKK